MNVTRRSVWAGALAAGVAPHWAARGQASYPGSQTIRLIVGFPAGGSQDNVGRILADACALVSHEEDELLVGCVQERQARQR